MHGRFKFRLSSVGLPRWSRTWTLLVSNVIWCISCLRFTALLKMIQFAIHSWVRINFSTYFFCYRSYDYFLFTEELKTLGLELQDMVQNKVGAVKFADVFNSIRQKVNRVRAERKTARVLQLSTNPQLASKRRIHKNNLKKDGRKRKAKNFAYVQKSERLPQSD